MITARYQRAVRNLGGFAGGTSRLARPPAVLEEPDLRPKSFGCSTVPLVLSDITEATIQSSSTTPDGATAVIVTSTGGTFTKWVYDTSGWSLTDSDVITGVVNADTLIAGDDGYFYNEQAAGGALEIWRWPIVGAGGAASLFCSLTGSDYFTGNNGIMVFGPTGTLYAGGQDGPTGDAILLSLDRTTGARTVLHQTATYDYIEPLCCTPDGAVWGWAIGPWPVTQSLFRWDGSLAIFDEYPNVDNGSGLFPCSDSSIGFCPGYAEAGVRVSPTGEVSGFDCLDGIDFTRDWNGPGGPNLLVPARVVADAQELTCG